MTVLDLGSGAGFDAFLAAERVGPEGRVLGVDMTPEMLALAKKNAGPRGAHNVEFREGRIEALPVEDASGRPRDLELRDQPERRQARGVPRDLPRAQAGGAVSVSDLVLAQPLPDGAQGRRRVVRRLRRGRVAGRRLPLRSCSSRDSPRSRCRRSSRPRRWAGGATHALVSRRSTLGSRCRTAWERGPARAKMGRVRPPRAGLPPISNQDGDEPTSSSNAFDSLRALDTPQAKSWITASTASPTT
jgi:hypothetical protein